jgi:hypothetical protein
MALSITLNWTYTGTCDGFHVKRYATGAPGGFAPIATLAPDATSYVDADPALVFGQQYQYQVTAFNAAGDSVATSVTVLLSFPAPAPVTNLTATVNH